MNKLKHTPGPWKAYNTDPVETELDIVLESEFNTIGWIYSGKENSENDARLIAAAPEMLEDLIDEARKQVIRIPAVKNIDEFIKNIGKTKIMQTIEKATGLTIEEVLNEN